MPNTTKRAAARGTNNVRKTVAINVQLPEALHRKLRVKALHEGKTVGEAVVAAITAWTK